jgi:hypothetical protein
VTTLAAAFLDHHARFRPIDATFMGLAGMGLAGHDARLPPVAAGTEDEERRSLSALGHRLAAEPEPADVGGRIDRRFVAAQTALAAAELDRRPRFANPAWWTGEAVFAIVALLLPQSLPVDADAVAARLAALPDFFAAGRRRFSGGAAPVGWTLRAGKEAHAFARFLTHEGRVHGAWRADWNAAADAAARAATDFAAAIADLPDADPACGAAHLDLIMRTVHGFGFGADAAVKAAEATFATLTQALEETAARIDPDRTWADQIAALSDIGPDVADVPGAFAQWHRRAMDAGASVVTPATEYALDFPVMDPAFREIAKATYFLSYRCPPAGRPGSGSVYWVPAPGDDAVAYRRANSLATIKSTHAIHHGSIGHHTQNARARVASSAIARVAGTDCATGIALLSAGTMVEGWACYAQGLAFEVGTIHTPAELLVQIHGDRRNAASVIADARMHTGEWTLDDASRFYRDEAGFPAARVDAEIVRNAMFPGSRLMYRLGVEAIVDLRRRWTGDLRDFHDTLIGFGHVPIAWIGEEMARARRLG